MSSGVMVLDAMGRLVDANPAARRIVAQLTGGSERNSLTQVWLDNQNFDAMSKEATDKPLELTSGDGQQSRYEVEVLPILDRRSQPAGNLALLQDVTERTQKDQERRRMEISALAQSKLATLGEVATGIAHEINQPHLHQHDDRGDPGRRGAEQSRLGRDVAPPDGISQAG